jgi:hypothetical protein
VVRPRKVNERLRLNILSKVVGLGLIALAMAAPNAKASTTSLVTSGCSLGCTTPPFALITLTQDIDLVSVDVTISMGSDSNGAYHFHKANDPNHFAFGFDLSGNPAVTFSNFILNGSATAGFTPAGTEPGSYSSAPFGTFDYALKCTGCGAGYGGGLVGPLSFTITPTSGSLTPASFITNSSGHLFTVDIVDFNGNSGNVSDAAAVTPEPSTMFLVGTSLLALAGLGSRFRLRTTRQPMSAPTG